MKIYKVLFVCVFIMKHSIEIAIRIISEGDIIPSKVEVAGVER